MPTEWSSFGECLRDHSIFLSQLPSLVHAYLTVDAKTIESIMLTVNSVNHCSYCTGLHGELARLAGISPEDANKLQTSESATESVKVMDTPAVRFAHAFAKTDGENVSKLAKDAKVSNAEKPKIIALSYFLYWGSYGGNTINTLLFCKRFSIFGLLFTLYYGALYIVVLLTTALLKVFPSNVPGTVSMVLGLVLTICAGTFIAPLGIIGKVLQY
jgi:AhpD family alkylhydroperoxidase